MDLVDVEVVVLDLPNLEARSKESKKPGGPPGAQDWSDLETSKTSPHGPSPHGLGTSEAPVARDILGERPKSQNGAVTSNPR